MVWINILDTLFPIGSVYFSINNTSPATKIGGTWIQITNAVIRASNTIGYSGSDTHTITLNEMPSHYHNYQANIQHGDGAIVTGEALICGLQVGGRRRYIDVTNSNGGGQQCLFFQESTIYTFGIEQPSYRIGVL